MKRVTIFIFCALLTLVCRAQSLSVESFKLLETDMTANTTGTMMRDQNGDVAALIRVVTTEKEFVFDGGMMGIVDTKQDVGEILVYVPGGIQKITIKHDQLGVLRDYYFPVTIEKGRTYELKLVSGQIQTTVIKAQTAQYVVFFVNPVNATVAIDGVSYSLNGDGQLSVRLPYGDHTYRIEAPSYAQEDGIFSVGQEKSKITVSLKSLMAELTVKTDSEAEIWVNEDKKATGFWTGKLVPGNYLIEARRQSHRTIMQEFVLLQQEQKSIELAAPTPITGSLQIESEPLECQIYIDGKQVGETPSFIDDCLIGEHTVTLKKDGYETKELTVTVQENKTSDINAELTKTSGNDAAMPESMPEFPGGTEALLQYLSSNVKYPAICIEEGIQGRVVITIIVDKDGSIVEPEVVQSVNPYLDKEALRVISAMPKWKPGLQDGKPVRVKYTIPINFRLPQ